MSHSVFVDPGYDLPLDRPSLSAPALDSVEQLLEYCAAWADEVGFNLTDDPDTADGIVVGPGVGVSPSHRDVVHVDRSQGVDGLRWGIRHVAYRLRWPFETVPYGLIADQEMDARRPRRTRHGVAVLLHGGFWMQAWRRDLMDGIAVDLAEHGWESYNAEYGRVGGGGTGGWPQTGQDVLSAIDTAVESAGVEAVTLIGHSAGAQLALWAAALRPETVERVVSLAGVCDLAEADRLRLGGGAVERFLDGAPSAAASPMDHVRPGLSILVAHCEQDGVVPAGLSTTYAHVAAEAGADVELLLLPDNNHMALIDPLALWPTVRHHLPRRGRV